ncbi:MAG: SDR family oxidoreductase [Paracoccaceae bacterium]|nr:MAG: NAD(P)-dependent oxidoreductase [Rhodobacteraceae bacterium MED-G07]
MKSPCLLIFGHGYTASALVDHLGTEDWEIFGTTRNVDTADLLKENNITPLMWSDDTSIKSIIKRSNYILHSIAPTEVEDPVYEKFAEDIIARSINLSWFGYLSTTSVYGNHDGQWVDEKTPVNPSGNRGLLRVNAENTWARINNLPLHIFRLAGIYGEGRSPLDKIRSGKAQLISKPGQFFSRIHVEDIAQVLKASIEMPNRGSIYNVCDDMPAAPDEVLAYAAKLLNYPEPPRIDFEAAELSPMAKSFYSDNKRVNNHLIKNEFSLALKFPNFKAGLDALVGR